MVYSSDAILAALTVGVVALSEGVRRFDVDVVVLRRRLLSRWRVARNTHLGQGFHIVALFMPIVLPLIVARDAGDAAERLGLRRLIVRLKSRGRRIAVELGILRGLGAVVLATLIVGVPVATHEWGLAGFLAAIGALVALTLSQAFITYRALMRVGTPKTRAKFVARKLVWPFNAPVAAEAVLTQVVDDVPALAVAYELMGENAFLNAFRQHIYDALRALDAAEDDALLFQLCPRATLSDFVRTPPAGAGADPFCPRCGDVYRKGTPSCSDCSEVALIDPDLRHIGVHAEHG